MQNTIQSGIYILCYRNSFDGVMKITPCSSFDGAVDCVRRQLEETWGYGKEAVDKAVSVLRSEGQWLDEENDDFFRIDATTLGSEVEYFY